MEQAVTQLLTFVANMSVWMIKGLIGLSVWAAGAVTAHQNTKPRSGSDLAEGRQGLVQDAYLSEAEKRRKSIESQQKAIRQMSQGKKPGKK